MVYNVVDGNVYALPGRHCGPHSFSIKKTVLNWHDHLFTAVPLLLLLYDCQQCCDTSVHSIAVPPLMYVCIRAAVNVPHPKNSRCDVPRRLLELDMSDDERRKDPGVV